MINLSNLSSGGGVYLMDSAPADADIGKAVGMPDPVTRHESNAGKEKFRIR
jgi:hypothetical protein